jgi:hypothetical protein
VDSAAIAAADGRRLCRAPARISPRDREWPPPSCGRKFWVRSDGEISQCC